MRRSVLQDWVMELTFMQQSVLLASIRGPDGLDKNHVSKKMIRWLRRCVLISAFDNAVLTEPWDRGPRQGGSFTGPSCEVGDAEHWPSAMTKVSNEYMLTLDEVPHHFQLHFLHAAEIIGYKHPDARIAFWWECTYKRLCNDMHLNPETEDQLNFRLGDREDHWRAKEEVRAD